MWGLAVGSAFGVLLLAARIITDIQPGGILPGARQRPNRKRLPSSSYLPVRTGERRAGPARDQATEVRKRRLRRRRR